MCRTDDTVLATAGFRGDITTLQKQLRAKLTQYEHQHGESIKVSAVAQMLGNTLYGKRFFPYYTWNVLAGMDGDGAVVRLSPCTPPPSLAPTRRAMCVRRCGRGVQLRPGRQL